MAQTITRTQQLGRHRTRTTRWLTILAGLLLAITTLGVTPASGQSEPPDDPHAQHKQFLAQYGDIGCAVVPGFTDRCPTMLSAPYHFPEAPEPEAIARQLVGSSDGRMLYVGGGQQIRDEEGLWYSQVFIVAYHAAAGDAVNDGSVAWSWTFGEPRHDTTADAAMAVSHDGRHLYLAGQSQDQDTGRVEGWVQALDAKTGAVLWQRSVRELMGPVAVVPGDEPPTIAPWALAVSPDDGQIAVSVGVAYEFGALVPAGRSQQPWYLALDAGTGALEWKARYEHTPSWPGIWGETLMYSPDGSRLFAQVNSQSSGLSKGIATLAYDAATGTRVWDQTHLYSPSEVVSGVRSPGGLIVSPDGSRVFAAAGPWFIDPETNGIRGSFLLLAYDAADGSRVWSQQFKSVRTICDENLTYVQTRGHPLAFSPSGDLLYLVGGDFDNSGCGDDAVLGPRVLAVHAATGQLAWDRLFVDGAGRSCFPGLDCDIAVAPGPGGGDAGSRVLVTTRFEPHHGKGTGRGPGSGTYPLMLAADGSSGKLLWQGRYLDTYADQHTGFLPTSPAVLDPDTARLYVAFNEWSKTRGWTAARAIQVMGYDIRAALPDLSLTDLVLSRSPHGETVLTVTVTNEGFADADGVVVRFRSARGVLGDSAPVSVKVGDSVTVSLTTETRKIGKPHDVTAIVNPDRTITELDYGNNTIRSSPAR